VFVTLITADGQMPGRSDIKGTLHLGKELVLNEYVAELDDLTHPGQAVHADVAADGTFLFRGISYGDYVLKITNYYGSPLGQQFLTVHENTPPVEVRLAEREAPRPANGRISLRELRHPPAAKAVAAALSGERLSREGQYERAAEEFRKAIRISPDYATAHS